MIFSLLPSSIISSDLGHAGAADNKQAAHMGALAYSFLWKTVGAGKAPQVSASEAAGQSASPAAASVAEPESKL